MLSQLDIYGMAIIDKISINFTSGFNVITGETGSGKSILIKALNLLLGAKASIENIKSGHDQTIVSGCFQLEKNHGSIKVLEKLGLPSQENKNGTTLLLRRSINKKGRSSAWVNDLPITLSSLKEISKTLVEVFAQHDNQKLLDESYHIQTLDNFLKDLSLKEEYQKSYRKAWSLFNEIQEDIRAYSQRKQESEFLAFKQKDIEKLDPSSEEFEKLKDFCSDVGTKLDSKEKLQATVNIFNKGHNGQALSSALWSGRKNLEYLIEKEIIEEKYRNDWENLASEIDELSYTVERKLEALDIDEYKIEESQSRLAQYQRFFRKLGIVSIEQLMEQKKLVDEKLYYINNAQDFIEEKLRTLAFECKKLTQQAESIHSERQSAAQQLETKVAKECCDLAMAKSKLIVDFQTIKKHLSNTELNSQDQENSKENEEHWQVITNFFTSHHENGKDKVRFLLDTGKGEKAHPLKKIASGGEISRLIIALKKAITHDSGTCTLVCDEIDTGISGKVATSVGKKLWEISQKTQIICISHLAQVAVFGKNHFELSAISKEDLEVKINLLNKKEKTIAIAQLLSGEKVNQASLENAKSLLKKGLSHTLTT